VTKSRKLESQSNRILVVDDDRDLRLLSADVLVRSGDHVGTAEDGAAG
jgi:CheY-like chemotaxis protein